MSLAPHRHIDVSSRNFFSNYPATSEISTLSFQYFFFFFLNDTPPPDISPLPLPAPFPINPDPPRRAGPRGRQPVRAATAWPAQKRPPGSVRPETADLEGPAIRAVFPPTSSQRRKRPAGRSERARAGRFRR